jgi:hypothetical protein
MQPMTIVLPILEGKRAALDTFVASLNEERSREFQQAQQTVEKEMWFVQPTPAGDLLILYFESPSPVQAGKNLAESEEPFDLWFKKRLQDITGVDICQAMRLPLPQMVLYWQKRR